jgi:hypothetical protein
VRGHDLRSVDPATARRIWKMKSCVYCGRENEDAAQECWECGTRGFKSLTASNDSKQTQLRETALSREVDTLHVPKPQAGSTGVRSIGPASFVHWVFIISWFWISMLTTDSLPQRWRWLPGALFIGFLVSGVVVLARNHEWESERPRLLYLPLAVMLMFLLASALSYSLFPQANAFLRHYAVIGPIWLGSVLVSYWACRRRGGG